MSRERPKCPHCGSKLWWSRELEAWRCPNPSCDGGGAANLVDELEKLLENYR